MKPLYNTDKVMDCLEFEINVRRVADKVLPAIERIAFTVAERPTIAIFPPPKKPTNDYSGNWYVPAESGWGLAAAKSPGKPPARNRCRKPYQNRHRWVG